MPINKDAFQAMAEKSGLSGDAYIAAHNLIEIYEAAKGNGQESAEQPVAITGEISDGYHTFNELYEHRHALFAAVCKMSDSWKSKLHNDGTMFDGWFIAGINTPDGQATYHLPMRLYADFPAKEIDKAPVWDGHTSNDVIARIRIATKRQPATPAASEVERVAEALRREHGHDQDSNWVGGMAMKVANTAIAAMPLAEELAALKHDIERSHALNAELLEADLKLREALAGAAIMLRTELKEYAHEPWACRINAALSTTPTTEGTEDE